MLALMVATTALAGAAVFASRGREPGAGRVLATVLVTGGVAVVSLVSAIATAFTSGCAELR